MARLAMLLLVFCGARELSFGQSAREYDLKSAFLYSFAKFVEWPKAGSAPLTLGVLGKDPFGASLDKTMEGKAVNGRPIVIKRSSQLSDLVDCQILFVPEEEEKRMLPALKTLSDRNILTVGETQGFTGAGGVLALLLERERIALEVNVDAAARAKIKISSRALEIARIVHASGSK